MFLITGIFYQRITDVVAFFISAVLLSIYVITHYVARRRTATGGESTKDANIRLVGERVNFLHSTSSRLQIRLILTVAFNVCFLPLAILVIRDYQRDEFSKRYRGPFMQAQGTFTIALESSALFLLHAVRFEPITSSIALHVRIRCYR